MKQEQNKLRAGTEPTASSEFSADNADGLKAIVMSEKITSKKAIIIIIAALVLAAAAIAVLAAVNSAQSRADGAREIEITLNGERAASLTIEQLCALPAQSFEDTIKETGRAAVPARYTGAELRDVLTSLKIDISNFKTAVFRGEDGYYSSAAAAEVLAPGKVYIVYAKDGGRLAPRERGGEGPAQAVIAGESFSLRNCKYLTNISFE